MVQPTMLARFNVAEVLRRWPQTARVFIDRRMACVGCPIARFESVADVAEAYQIPPAELVDALRGACGWRRRGPPRQKMRGRKDGRGRTGSAIGRRSD